MDRQITFPGSIPLDTDLLNTNRNTMIALGLAMQDILGTNTVIAGFPCTQTLVASLAVLVGPGRIYNLQNVDGTNYGSLLADTADQILKQGIQLGNVTLATPAPTTAGQSINYLIEASFLEVDATPVTLPYFNVSNPSVPFSGPNNSGTPQNTQRKGTVVVQVKAGIPATTGTQTTPTADAGFIGMYSVTVAQGQATVTSTNIARLLTAPFIAGIMGANGAITLGYGSSPGLTINGPIAASGSGTTLVLNSFAAATDNDMVWLRGGVQSAVFGSIGTAGNVIGGSLQGDMCIRCDTGRILLSGSNLSAAMVIDSTGAVFVPNVGTTASAANAFINNASSPANSLLRSTSSIRYKQDVTDLDHAVADKLLALRPVSYRSKATADDPNAVWYGLIAEEVAAIEPRLVHYSPDESGVQVPDGVQYDRVGVLLLDLVQRMDARLTALEQ